MADSDTTQQVTSQTPGKKPEKSPKRVAAGKAIAEKTRLAREAQKKALDDANAIIANQEKKAPETEAQASNQEKNSDPEAILTTTQWLSFISIFLSMLGIYFKRKEIKAIFNPPVEPKKEGTPPVEPKKEGRIRDMD